MKNFSFAVKEIIPIMFEYIFVGIAFGMLLNDAGYNAVWAFICGFFIYAGSMQIVMISLMTSGVPLYMIAVMTFFINARHIFYGLGFVNKFRKMGWKYPYMVLTMTDETYSIRCNIKYPEEVDEQKVDFYIALLPHLLWTVSCVIGAMLGGILHFDMTGIEFSATAFFVTVCVNQWTQFGSRIPAVAGLISAVLFYIILGADNFLLPALSVSLVVLIIMKDKVMLQMGGMQDVR
ncbi:AzlC family ABC transporter permease [Aminipila terrae]|uniref:Branched-chain amino acid transporter AzlC n=1 Tax=Aminipila terrae TaxID=2697030 RepID=A0A6P1MF89_9FIRM|nr:AzlC family ABC transporter permease [Aminipila terrae]QHI71813.1 branched-chain amino acid transporter AzlC [Aminipila terrae]